jgi:MYXO-CTERM domain-containing protein
MRTRHNLRDLFLFGLALATLAPASASADVIPMDVTACDMHTVGAACMDSEGSGICTMDTCHRLDYAHWDHDASASPPSMAYDCVRCVVGGPIDAGPSGGDDAGPSPMAPPPAARCAASPGTGGSAAWIAALGVALALARRRRSV